MTAPEQVMSDDLTLTSGPSGIVISVVITYSCLRAPEADPLSVIISPKSGGFIYAWEYACRTVKVVAPIKKVACRLPQCENAFRYEGNIVVYVEYLKRTSVTSAIGAVFGSGSWEEVTPFEVTEKFRTKCLCCNA